MPARLLVVEDEAPIRYALRDYFEAAGYDVDCAASVAEATAALDARPYGAVIADLRLDRRAAAGLDVVQTARERCRATSIIVLSAYGSEDLAAEALRRGADAFLDKPVPLAEISRILAEARHARTDGGARSG